MQHVLLNELHYLPKVILKHIMKDGKWSTNSGAAILFARLTNIAEQYCGHVSLVKACSRKYTNMSYTVKYDGFIRVALALIYVGNDGMNKVPLSYLIPYHQYWHITKFHLEHIITHYLKSQSVAKDADDVVAGDEKGISVPLPLPETRYLLNQYQV